MSETPGEVVEPVFVPIDPPPLRRSALKRGDAVLRAIEASYASEPDLHEWLEGIMSELDGLGLGTWGSVPVSEGLPIVGARMIIPKVGLSLQVNERASTSRHLVWDTNTAASVPESRLVSTLPHWGALIAQSNLSFSEAESLFGFTLPSLTAVLCTSTDGREGVVAMLDNDRPLPARIRYQLEAVAAHIEHAYRLRRTLAERSSEEARAVLSPDGKLLHAEPEAVPNVESLALAVKRSEQARGRMRRLAPEEAVETWKALVEGQWSIAEQVESDGKRFILAFENAPVTPALKLSAQEKRVVSYAALGHQQKYIAYELGLTPSTVSRHLRSALGKLRLESRQELISALGPRRSSRQPQSGDPPKSGNR